MLWLKFLLILFFSVVRGDNSEKYLDKFCKKQMDEDYQAQDAPKNEDEPGQPLKVFVQFQVIDIDEIDGDHMDYRLHTYFKMLWKDPRLKRKDVLTNDCSAYVWTPDVMFETVKSIQSFDNVKTDFRIEPTGLAVMMNRYSFKANCRMDFRSYPFDTQDCMFTICFENVDNLKEMIDVQIKKFLFLVTTTDDVALLKWIDDESSPHRVNPIKFLNEIEPLQYHLGQPKTYSVIKKFTYGNYTYLYANFTLVRRLTGPVVTTYIPTALVVAISWFPFWLNPDDAAARVSLSITSLLTLCTQVQQYKSYLPPVNYITAMDIWLFVCIFVVFSTLLEFVLGYKSYSEEGERKNKAILEEIDETKSMTQVTKTNSWIERKKDTTNLCSRIRSIFALQKNKSGFCSFPKIDSVKMDMFCRTFFPSSFLAFTIIYSFYFMKAYDYIADFMSSF